MPGNLSLAQSSFFWCLLINEKHSRNLPYRFHLIMKFSKNIDISRSRLGHFLKNDYSAL